MTLVIVITEKPT
jgi:hypothetical protein